VSATDPRTEAVTVKDSSLLGRLAIAADNARYEWHCFRHGGKYDDCNQGECQETIALYAEYCARRADAVDTRVQQLTGALRELLAAAIAVGRDTRGISKARAVLAEVMELDAIEAGECDNTGLEAIRGWLCSDEALYVGSMDGDALDALALRLFTTAAGSASPKEDA
jgi:hypothetical protein